MKLVRYSYPTYRTGAPAFATRSPWAGLETEIDRLFASAVTSFDGAGVAGFPVDLFEDKDNIFVRAELPGVSREEIDVHVVDGHLTIAGTRKNPGAEGQAADSLAFSRSIAMADEVQADRVHAAYEHGVLTVTLPKREETKPKKITVAVK